MIYVYGFIFISIIGTLLHFIYDISNHNKIVGLFGAVNESVWEHIKMALTPFFLWSLVDGYKYGDLNNFFLSKFVGVMAIIIVISLIFFVYKIFTKKSALIIDILLFYVAIGVSQYLSYLIINASSVSYTISFISCVLFFIIFGFYMTATLFPIKSKLFKDPLTKKYGIDAHK